MHSRAHQACDIGVSWFGFLGTVTLIDVSHAAAALAGIATFGFTVHRWIHWHRKHRD